MIIKDKKFKRSQVLYDILKITAGVAVIPAVFIMPGMAILCRNFLKEKNIEGDYWNFKRALIKAKKNKLLRIIENKDGDFLEVTERGRKELMRYDIDNLTIKRSLRWDGVWRVVIFDIPEKYRDARVALSKKLKEIGFCQLQKSVFVFPFSCEKEIDFIKMFYQIEKFIILFNTKSFGEVQDLILKRRFDLF